MTAARPLCARVAPRSGAGVAMTLVLRLHAAAAGLRGWRRALLSVILGVAAALAMPPVLAWPALVPAFTGLAWLVDRRMVRRRAAFAVGWWFGLGFFCAGLYWIANAFAARGEPFVWFGPPAVLAMSALLAVFPALACLIARLVGATGIGAPLVLAASWTLLEWLRCWVLTGFPWNLVGSVWVGSDAMLQGAAAVGTLGLSLITVTAAAMPSALADRAERHGRAQAATIAAFAVLAAVWGAGELRLTLAGATEMVDGIRLRLVQPDIPQGVKWRRGERDQHVRRQIALGATPAAQPPTHVIWSETAAPMFLDEDAARRAWIAAGTPPGGLTITGTLRRSATQWPFDLFNSMVAINDAGAVVGHFDKVHLVPFGEYMPLRGIIGLDKLTEGTVDFTPGDGLHTLDLPGLPPVGPLICYEVIFPGEVVGGGERPQWLLNLTNDGWYGISSGPYQHFAAARLRAVEEGLPVVRVANTGISGIIDGYGRVVAELGLGEEGVVDGPLPRPAATEPPYGRFGNRLVLPLLLAAGFAGWLLGGRRH